MYYWIEVAYVEDKPSFAGRKTPVLSTTFVVHRDEPAYLQACGTFVTLVLKNIFNKALDGNCEGPERVVLSIHPLTLQCDVACDDLETKILLKIAVDNGLADIRAVFLQRSDIVETRKYIDTEREVRETNQSTLVGALQSLGEQVGVKVVTNQTETEPAPKTDEQEPESTDTDNTLYH